MKSRPRIVFFALAAAVAIYFVSLRSAETQTSLRRITHTTDEGISINPSISGDGRIIGFESTEDVAGAGGTNHFRAIRANISVDPPTFFQMGRTRADAPGISQDGSRLAFASKDDPLGTNADGNSEIFVFNGSNLVQVTNTTPGNSANRATEGNFQPSMSDDGRFVAFSSNRNLMSQNGDGNLEVFVFDSVAAAFTQLTNSTGIVGFSDAKISGDASAIACIRDPGATASTNRDLLRISRTNGAQTVLSLNVARLAMTYGRAISDDGTRVAYSAETAANSTQVFYYDGRSGNVNRQVTTLGTRVTEVPLHPTISGDGRRIAFATRRALTGFTNSDASVELYTHDIPTGTFARVTNTSDNDADCFDGSSAACEVVSSLNDDGSTVVFNFPRALSGTVTAGLENKSEIYATGLVARPPFGTLTSILNQASLGHEPSPIKAVAPNSIAAAFGNVLANTTQQAQKQPNGEFPTNVGGTTVTVNGRAAQIFFVSPERVHFLVPPQTEIGNAEVVITNADDFASKGTVPILRAAPGIFTKTGDGIGEGMILDADTLAEGPFDPSGGNLRLLIFSTGVRNGITRTLNIGGRVVTPEAVNESTEMPGLDEVLVRVPADLRGAGNVNLFIQADGRDSNPVTVKFLGDPGRNVLINEVLADPPDGIAGDANHDGVRDGTDDEFVELVNGTSGEVISLGGWTIRTRPTGSTTETTRFTFASGTSLPASEAIVVFGGGSFNPSDTVFGCAQVVQATTTAGLSLTNSGVTILIRDASGNLITEFSYGGSTSFVGDNNQSLARSPDITGAYVQHTTAAGANGRRFSPGLRTDGTPFGACPAILTTVTIAPPTATIDVGQTQQFTAQAFDQYGRAMTGVTITFSSDNTTVATVESVTMNSTTGVATANVLGRNPGTTHITASVTDGANTVNSTQANLTVTGPALSINDVSQSEGNAGTSTFTFTVTLSTAPTAPVTFDIATQDSTATSASGDYVARSLTSQTIAVGQQNYTFDVTVNGDVAIEQTEAFFVNVSNVSGASVTDAQGVGTIVTDDIPVLSVNDVTREEGNTGTTTFTFTVSSNLPAPPEGITFDIATQDSSATVANGDYVARSLTSQSIPSGQFSYTFDVTVNGDTTVETNETFFVNISNVSANASIADGQGVGTIQNDDLALMVISQIYGGGNNSGATFKNDFVELFNRGTTTVDLAGWSVQQASATGASWSATELCPVGSCLVAPGKYFLVKLAPANPTIGADLPAPDATGTSNLSATSGKVALVNDSIELTGSGCPFGLSIVDFVGYGSSANCSENSTDAPAHSNTTADFRKSGGCIDTNDNAADFVTATPNPRNSNSPANDCSTGFRPDITINNVSISEGNSGTKTVDFIVALSAANNFQIVTVNYATADGTASSPSDYQSTSGQLMFNPGETSKPVTVTIVGDTTLESDESFFVNLTNPVNAVILDGEGQGTITEDEVAPTLSINDVSMAEGHSGTKIFQFTVSLSGPALSGGVTFDIATQDNSATVANGDYVANSLTSQTIPAGQQTYTFNVTVNGDGDIEPNETFFVNVTSVSGATAGDTQGVGTIQTDDSPVLSINDVSTTEGDTGTKIFTFTISSSIQAPAGGITFDITTQDGTAQDDNPASEDNDYVANSTIGKTIAAGTTSTTFNVTVNGDKLVEPNEIFNVIISNASGGMAVIGDDTGVGTIQNDDTALLVISQLYGGGNNSGATFQNDFVEIFNRGTTMVDFSVTPYSVQYASVGSNFGSSRTNLTTGSIAPGQYFLVRESGGTTNGAPLPSPDATGSITMASTSGKVALVVGTSFLTAVDCPGDDGSAPFNPVGGTIADLVGYGSTAANVGHCYEGSGPAPAPSNTTADYRKFDGCQDTNDNAADFLTATPVPRNSSSPANDCTAADVSITKTDAPDPVVTGSNVTYTITVTNNGPATAQSVVVTDNLPGNVTFVSCASTGAGVCSGSGNNRTITFASLAAGTSETITLVATANGPAGTPISNTATVSSTTTDSISGNNSATATTAVVNPTFANLSIVKTDSPDPVFPTGTLTYTLSVTNNGPDTAQSVVVTDTLSSDVTFVDCASNQGGVCGGTATSPTITFSSLANGVTATITIHVTVNSNVTDGTVISNTASVTSATADSTPGNNSDSEDTTVQEVNAGELLISEFRTRGPSGADDDFVEIYNPTTTTLTIGGLKIRASNDTGSTTDRVTITPGTTLGPGCHYLIAKSTASGYSGVTAPNQTYTDGITNSGGIAITRANGTTIIDQVGMSAGSAYKEGTPLAPLPTNVEQSYERKPGGAFGNGTDTNNNSADFFLNASSSNPQNSSSGCINTSAADVSITKTDAPDPVVTGSNVTYTITVTNNGPATAQSVVVTDNLSGSVTLVSCASTGSGVCGGTGNNRTVTFASLAAGATETITLVATANGAGGTTITNTATVASTTTDSNSANNSATATTAVINQTFANLAITKSDSIDPVAPGGTLTYTLNVTNNGPDTAPSVVVTDNLSSDVTFIDCASTQGGTCGGTPTSPTISFTSLANGVTAVITIRVTVGSSLTTGAVITNTASVTSTAVDSVSGNNSDTETTNVQAVVAGEILISEFRFRGSAGANDEFIELYNPTTRTIDISGFKIFRSNASASTALQATINSGVLLPPGCHYLLTNANSSGPYDDGVLGDQTYGTGTTPDGGIAVTLASSTDSTGILDQVGLSSGSAYKEGTPLASLGTDNDQTYERKPGGAFGNGTDTNDNSADFFLNPSSNPQNSSSGCIDVTAADVAITKTDSPDPVVTGSNVTYTITVTNSGPATAQSVIVTDNLPANVTFVSCVAPGGTCNVGGGNSRTITFTSLAAGASETITLVATANGPAGTPISNMATVNSTTTDSNSANNSATATTAVINQTFADLAITKSDSIDPVAPGGTLTYTLNVTNNGPDTVTSVVVTDNLSSDVTFIDCASTQGGTCGGTPTSPTVSFTSLANGVTAIITIRVTVGSGLTTGAVITNTASVTSTAVDSVSGNNSDTETTNVQAVVAGEILISEFRFRGSAGANDEFIELYNPTTRTIDISGFKIFRSSSAGVTSTHATINSGVLLPGCHYLLTNSNSGGPYNDSVTGDQTYGTGTADDGGLAVTLASGTASSGILDQVGLSAGSAYQEGTPLASLGTTNDDRTYERKPGGSFGNGTDTNNNSADFLLNASGVSNPQNSSTGCIDVTAADLAITKTDSPDPVVTGSNVTYTITVTNNGPATAQSVVVTDNLPGSVTFVSCASTGSGVCGGTGNNRTVSFSSLASSATETITLVATANGAGGTTITNTATVASITTDSNSANNSATATTAVINQPFANLAITKSDSIDPVAPGGTLTYTLNVTNNGPDTAPSVVVTDNLSSDVTFIDCSSTQGGVCGGTPTSPTISFTSLANGVTAVITIRVTVGSGLITGAVITNTASVTSTAVDSVSGNNSDTETTNVQAVNPGDIVFSEVRFIGSAGANDDFVELYNPTTRAIDISGFKVFRSNGTGTQTLHVTISSNVILSPGCHYLLTHTAYDDGVPGDQTYGTSITNDGGVAVTLPSGTASTGILDQVGLSSGSAYKEGTPLTALTTNVDRSYERKPGGASGNGTDTNNNASDFFLNAATSNPQNSSSGCLNTSTADLSIAKSDSPDPVMVGSDITYTITVTNNGIGTASNVVVTDNLPSSLTFVSCNSTGGGVCNGAGNNRTVNFNSLSVGGSATITIVATVNGTGGASISNTATVSAATTDPNNANDSATATTTVSSADLSITKSDSPDPVNAGENIAYTINVTNNSATIPSESVTMSDPLPSNTTLVSVGATPVGWTRTDSTAVGATGTITYTKTTLAASATATFTITVKVDSGAANNSTISNTASVSSNTPDDTPANNSALEPTTVRTPADLSLSKSVNDATPNVGDQVTFTITVSNGGPYAATGVLVKDVLPAGLSYVSDNGSGSYTSGTGIWNVGTVNAGAFATLNVTASVTSSAVSGVTNTAEITGSDQFDPDSTVNNNNAGEDDQASATVTAKSADLSLTKTVDDSSPAVSQNVTFTVTLSNGGPDAATNVVVKDQLPAGMTFVSANPSQGTYSSGSGIWNVGTVNASSSATLEITATVTSSGTITNTAELTASAVFDPDSTPNNQNAGEDDQASSTVSSLQADLSLLKTVDDATPNVGDQVVFTITLTNGGPDAATGVVVKDQLPAGLDFDSAIPSQGTYAPATGIWNVGTVNASSSATLQITATVTSSGTVTNTAEVTASDGFDPDSTPNNHNAGEDDQASSSITPKQADLSLLKSVNNATPDVGNNVIFTITLSNAGPDTATNVQVTDQLPAGLSFQSASPSQGTYTPASGLWVVGTMNVSASATLQITATVTTNAPVTNTATITASDVFDPVAANNTASVTVTPKNADLSITKTDSPDPVAVGNDITYTVTVTNAGPAAASSAVFSDTVPTNTTFQSISAPAGWTCGTTPAVGGTGAISCTNPSFAVGSGVFTLVVRVGAAVTDNTTISNTASISSNTFDPNIGNESATQTTTVRNPAVVISQVYAGGGNAGAPYLNDFVEIFNRTGSAIDISNWSIQTATATGTTWTVIPLCPVSPCTIGPNKYYLVRLGSGGAIGAALPTPDATGSTNFAVTGGKAALVNNTTALSGSAAGTTPLGGATCPNVNTASVLDFVGFGNATCFEGSAAAPALSNTTADLRGSSGCTDTNSNSTNFATGAPNPRNSTSSFTCP